MSTVDLNYNARELLKARLPAHLLTRADRVRALDEIYVTRADDGKFQMELEIIMAHILNENAHEGYAVAVTGPTGAGKTTLVNTRLDDTKALAPFDDGYGNQVEFCLRVQTPSSCTARDLGLAILRSTGYPLERTPIETDVWSLVRKRLRLKMHKIIFLDEFQHVLKGGQDQGHAAPYQSGEVAHAGPRMACMAYFCWGAGYDGVRRA